MRRTVTVLLIMMSMTLAGIGAAAHAAGDDGGSLAHLRLRPLEATPQPQASPLLASIREVGKLMDVDLSHLDNASSEKGGATCVINTISCGATRNGTLTTTDCELDFGQYTDFWEFQGSAGQTVTINASSNNFDTFLALLDPTPEVVISDDDSGPGTNSRIVFTLNQSGSWAIAVVNFIPSDLGSYTVSLACSGGSNPPAAPSSLTATPLSESEIQLNWQDNSNDENEFRVEVRGPSTGFQDIGSVAANSIGVIVNQLNADTTYDFRVRARRGSQNSAYSNQASATTFPGGPVGPCVPNSTTHCLFNDRFKVEVDWRDFSGNDRVANVVDLGPFSSDDSGLFYFLDDDNWEMLVKIVNACNDPGFRTYWVFAAATTNVQYLITVTDTETGATKSYFNPLGNPAPAVTDTRAFATCP